MNFSGKLPINYIKKIAENNDNNININILYVELILLIDSNILKLFIKSKL